MKRSFFSRVRTFERVVTRFMFFQKERSSGSRVEAFALCEKDVSGKKTVDA